MTDRIDDLREALLAACQHFIDYTQGGDRLSKDIKERLLALRPKAFDPDDYPMFGDKELRPKAEAAGDADERFDAINCQLDQAIAERDRLAAENARLVRAIDERDVLARKFTDLGVKSCGYEQQIRDLTAERDRLKAEVDRLRTAQTEVKADLQQMVALLTGKEQP